MLDMLTDDDDEVDSERWKKQKGGGGVRRIGGFDINALLISTREKYMCNICTYLETLLLPLDLSHLIHGKG